MPLPRQTGSSESRSTQARSASTREIATPTTTFPATATTAGWRSCRLVTMSLQSKSGWWSGVADTASRRSAASRSSGAKSRMCHVMTPSVMSRLASRG
ncbi:MAG: hypothetical protein JWR34_4655 [Mycobacterium sp.]|nr:hypothetical protein [Mycobacterium sp.]